MASTPVLACFFLLAFLLAFVALLPAGRAAAQPLPGSVLLRFEDTTQDLDREAIRSAITRELDVQMLSEAPEQAPTLTIALTPQNELQVTYRPARESLSRSVPLATAGDAPALAAHLAGNLVRNEAFALVTELQAPGPAQSAGSSHGEASPPTAPPPTAPPPTTVSPTTVSPQPTVAPQPERDAAAPSSAKTTETGGPGPKPPAYLADKWITSALLGFDLGPDEQFFATLQQGRRLGRFELSLGVQVAYGRTDALLMNGDDERAGRVSLFQLTFPVTAEYRVLGHDEAYLQLGASVGYRLAGIVDQPGLDLQVGETGTEGFFSVALHATIGFAVGDNNGFVLRVSGGLDDDVHVLPYLGGRLLVDSFSPLAQVGWQVGW